MSVHADEQLVADLQAKIDELLQDELLSDVPEQPTVEDLDALIAVEINQAYKIKIDRSPLPSVDLIVRQNSTVRDIKRLFRNQVERMEQAQVDGKSHRRRSISWKYIWRTYCLMFEQIRLSDDNAIVSQLGIKQNSVLTFARLSHEKGVHRKAWKRTPRRRKNCSIGLTDQSAAC